MSNILNRTLFRLLMMATLFVAITLQQQPNNNEKTSVVSSPKEDAAVVEMLEPINYNPANSQRGFRWKRATSLQQQQQQHKRRPGFFRTLFSVIYEQWNDTRHTAGKINSLVSDNFIPENAPVTTAKPSLDPNATTTMAPYKITRSEFQRIVMRNLRGLVRLYNIELRDALKQSDKNWPEYRRNATLEVSKFL